jgi:hypothetical protein
MKGLFLSIIFFIALPCFNFAQEIVFSEPLKEDSRDMNFEVVGKLNGNILVFKNVRWHYAVSVYNNNMELKEKVDLDFLPPKTFNTDLVTYPDFFYLIYQYQKKGIVYCMAAKIGAEGKKIGEPVQLDTTQVGSFGENKIYSTINSEDKGKIMIFKIQSQDQKFNFVTLLFDNQLQLIHKTRQAMDYDDRKDEFSDFSLDNEGNFVFTKSVKKNNRESLSQLSMFTKAAVSETFIERKIDLNEKFIDEVKIKIDNVNKRYLFNTLYFKDSRGNVEGLFSHIWDVKGDSSYANVFTEFSDSIRVLAKSNGNIRFAFNDYFIQNILLKKDGSYLLTAEDFSSQSTGTNNWNRFDYLYGSPLNNNFYYYNPAFGNYYRPFGSNNLQTTRYYYENILVIGIGKNGIPDWSHVIPKQQYSDDTENFLSFGNFNAGGEIHFLFNDISKREKLLANFILSPTGMSRRSPTLRSYEKGYEYMPRFCKQVGARQVIMPCTYRNQICFAKIDF